jgi:isopentenyl-diphosphate Delta-isomerase
MNTRQPAFPTGPTSTINAPEERVILVNALDEEIGTEGKLRAHQRGLLHRAFSVFVFDHQGRVLLQRRAAAKYHSGGLWSNTCCGHPRPGELVTNAAARRLSEEMGINCELLPRSTFTYRADLAGGLVEHEIDHLLTGTFQGSPMPNPDEVEGWGWMPFDRLVLECAAEPSRYSAWLPMALAALSSGRLS